MDERTEKGKMRTVTAPIVRQIRAELLEMQDTGYRDFHSKLMPTVEKERVIGIRVPQLRKYARQMAKDPEIREFLAELPHYYYEENNLHAFLLEQIRDYDVCVREVERFLPYVDNWATCDGMSPKIFARHREELLTHIRRWIASDKVYTIRYGIGMLMTHYLEADFRPEYPEMVAKIRSEEYYVNMMIAWYFATALAKQYNAVLAYLENRRLARWTHNKTIQKACESYRITVEQKAYLRTLKM